MQMKQILLGCQNNKIACFESRLYAILAPKLLSKIKILRDASNELLNAYKSFKDSQCNDGYHGSCGKFRQSIKIINSYTVYCVSLISDIVNCMLRP